MKGLLVKKIGMTHVICPETSRVTPVTLLQVPDNKVLQVKTLKTDGYNAAVLGAFERKNFGKNENKKYKFIKEIPEVEGVEKGQALTIDFLEGVTKVRVSGTSKGKGFSGIIKRYNFSRGPETHGSHHHREPGSVGMCAKPGRILKGKKMPGHHGSTTVSFRSVDVVKIDKERNIIAVKGSVPGAKNSLISLIEA